MEPWVYTIQLYYSCREGKRIQAPHYEKWAFSPTLWFWWFVVGYQSSYCTLQWSYSPWNSYLFCFLSPISFYNMLWALHAFINLFKVSCFFLGLPGYLRCSGMRVRMRDQSHVAYNFSITLQPVTGPHSIHTQHVVVGSMTCCPRAEQPGQPSAWSPALLGCANHIWAWEMDWFFWS